MASVHRYHIDALLVVETGGTLDPDRARRVLLRAVAEPDACLLVDCSGSRHAYGFADVLRLVDEAARHPEARAKRIAFVNTFFNRSELTFLMAERGRDEGLETRAFLTADEAVAWLEAGGCG